MVRAYMHPYPLGVTTQVGSSLFFLCVTVLRPPGRANRLLPVQTVSLTFACFFFLFVRLAHIGFGLPINSSHLPIFTQLDRTSIKLQGFQEQRHRLLPVCVLNALQCFWRATKGHRVRQISKSKVKAQVCTTRHKFAPPGEEDCHFFFRKI